ncbi:MAG: hypothetical protein ACYS99_13305 [Planctomycetota bacterium]
MAWGLFLLASGPAAAELTEVDRAKIREWMAACFDPWSSGGERALEGLTEFLGQRGKRQVLADVDTLSRLLARSAERRSQAPGIHDRKLRLADLGADSDEIYRYVVSVPDGYRGDLDGRPWPLIVCLPDKGQDSREYLDRYWADPAVRRNYLIVVLGFLYDDVIPLRWDSLEAARQYWAHLFNLQMLEFKVDPDRIVLDGAGFGARGALYWAATSSRVFAGLISRGVKPEGPGRQNLAHLKVLTLPRDVAGSLRSWLADCVRERYPLPSAWSCFDGAAQSGYWVFVQRRTLSEEAETTVSSDRAANRVDIAARNVSELTLFLNDRLVDLSRPFEVRINGHSVGRYWRPRSVEQLLGHAMVTAEGMVPYEPGVVFTAEVVGIEVPEEWKPPPPPASERAPSSDLLERLLLVVVAAAVCWAVLALAFGRLAGRRGGRG